MQRGKGEEGCRKSMVGKREKKREVGGRKEGGTGGGCGEGRRRIGGRGKESAEEKDRREWEGECRGEG